MSKKSSKSSTTQTLESDLPDLAKPPAKTVADIPDRQVEDALAQFTDSLVDHDSAYSNAKHEVEVAERQLEEKKAILKFEADKVRAALKALNHPDVEKALSGKYYDAVLREALKGLSTEDYCNRGGVYGNHPIDGVKPWGDWIKLGATDAQIVSNLRKGFRPVQRHGSSIQIGAYEKSFALVRRGEHGSELEKIISGDELVSEIRRVLAIPQPKPAAKPAATSTKPGSTKLTAGKPAAKKSAPKPAAKNSRATTKDKSAEVEAVAKKISAKSAKPAKEKDDGFGNITSMKLEKDGKGIWRLKYRKGTHTKLIYVGDKHPSDESARDAAIAAFNKKEKLNYPAASIRIPEEFTNQLSLTQREVDADPSIEAPSNDDQTDTSGALDLTARAAADDASASTEVDSPSPVDAPGNETQAAIFQRDGRWRLILDDVDPDAEPLKLDATTQEAAIAEVAEFVECDLSEVKVIADPATAEVSS